MTSVVGVGAGRRLFRGPRERAAPWLALSDRQLVGLLKRWPVPLRLVEDMAAADTLSRRQRQVLELAARGRGVEESAAELGVRPVTVKLYRRLAVTRLGARNLVNAVAIALDSEQIEFRDAA